MNKGIYKITCLVSGKIYIGLTVSKGGFEQRWNEHKAELSKNKHCNQYLQAAWNKYGSGKFKFGVIERCSLETEAKQKEAFWIKFWNAQDEKCGYNLTAGGEASPMSNEKTRAKQKKTQNKVEFKRARSERLKISHNKPETKAKMAAIRTKLWADPKFREKHREALKAAYASKEVRERNAELRRAEWKTSNERKTQHVKMMKELHKNKPGFTLRHYGNQKIVRGETKVASCTGDLFGGEFAGIQDSKGG